MKYEQIFQLYLKFDESIKIDFYRISEHKEVKESCNFIILEMEREGVFQKKSARKISKIKEYVKLLLCNFFVAYELNKCVAIPRTKSFYSDQRNFHLQLISHQFLMLVLDWLIAHGYIGEKNGYKAYADAERSYVSRYWAKEKLYSQFAKWSYEMIESRYHAPEIIMKDSDKNIIHFKGNDMTKALRAKIAKLNELYECTLFYGYADGKKMRLFPRISAIYNDGSWEHGGRLYCKSYRGANYQQFSKEERPQITIDLQPTVERDFSCLHLSMLYARQHMQIQGDAYGFLPPQFRNEAKKAVNVFLNAANAPTAVGALKSTQPEFDWWGTLHKLKITHGVIARYFCSGIGVQLQNEDSKIAMDILMHFAEQEVAALPMHDSFIVSRKYQAELDEVMRFFYHKHTGFKIRVH